MAIDFESFPIKSSQVKTLYNDLELIVRHLGSLLEAQMLT